LKGKQTQALAILKKFISDEFDADRADFLLRDSYFCGVKYGEYDYIRYAGSFRLIDNEKGEKAFAIEKGNLHAVEAFLFARYHYYLQVPYHRTRKGYDIVLERYFRDLTERDHLPDAGVDAGGTSDTEIDFERFQYFDDYTIFEQIKNDMAGGNPWAKILMRQDRLHPIFDTEKESEGNENDFLDLQEELDNTGLKEDQDYFTFDKKVEVHKILEKSDEKGESVYPVVDKNNDYKMIGSILDHSSILESTRKKPAHLRRIYVTTFSKPMAEKALFYLQEKGLPLRLDFEPYSYGPFSRQVMETASELERAGEILVGRTDYTPGPGFAGNLPEEDRGELNTHLERFCELLGHDFSFENLELCGTVLYCIQALQENGLDADRDSVIREVEQWKGKKYARSAITAAYDALAEEFVNTDC
jgi:hypothetical protein